MIDGCVPNADGSCSICGDVALPARVISVDSLNLAAEVADEAGSATVALDLVGAVAPGDLVLVHLGFAISVLEARK